MLCVPWSRLYLLLAFAVAPPALAAPIDDANAAYQRGNYAAAEQILLPLADAGNAYAQYRLGLVYLEATNEMKSPEEAAKWLESAALQGQPHAQYKLGILYVNGNGVSRDFVAGLPVAHPQHAPHRRQRLRSRPPARHAGGADVVVADRRREEAGAGLAADEVRDGTPPPQR